MIFAPEKIVPSTGTQTARRSPVSAASCRRYADQPRVAATNQTANQPLEARKPRFGAHTWMPSRKIVAATAAVRRLVRYEPAISRSVVCPAVGTKRISALVRFSCATPARNIIAEMAAEFRPTISGR